MLGRSPRGEVPVLPPYGQGPAITIRTFAGFDGPPPPSARELLQAELATIDHTQRMRQRFGVLLGDVSLPDTLVTPAAVTTAMDDVNNHVLSFNTDVLGKQTTLASAPDGQRFLRDWSVFKGDWSTWYSSERRSAHGALLYITTALVDQLRSRTAAYNTLEQRGRDLGVSVTPVGGGGGTSLLPTEAWVAIGIGSGVIALGLVAWIAHSVSRVAAPIARATAGRKR